MLEFSFLALIIDTDVKNENLIFMHWILQKQNDTSVDIC